MRLCTGFSFVSFHRFLQHFHLQLFLFLCVFFAHFIYGRLIFLLLYQYLSLADPFDRMQVWLFFLYLCRLIFICLPLSVPIKVALSSLYAVSHPCLGLHSCCYSLAGSFQFFFNFAPRSRPLCLFIRLAGVQGSGVFFPLAFLPCLYLSDGSLSVSYHFYGSYPAYRCYAVLLLLVVGSFW